MSDETVIQPAEVKAPKVVELSIASLLADLKNGIDRKAQAVKYGVPLAVINRAYLSNPALKGKKVKKEREKRPGSRTIGFVFTDADQFVAPTEEVVEGNEAVESAVESPVVDTPAPVTESTNSGW